MDADREWIKAAAFAGNARSCGYSFVNVATWADAYGVEVAPVAGRVAFRVAADGYSYSWGVGDDGHPEAFVRALQADAAERGQPFALCGLGHEARLWLESRYPGAFEFFPNEGYWDYCYAIGNLATLPGGKFQKKRNHVHAFEAAFPGWRVEPVVPANVDACLAVAAAWDAEDAADGTQDAASKDGERALRMALAHVADWQLDGLVLFAAGRPVAFSLGERLSREFYDVTFEKAPRDLRGAYAMINREFARFIAARYPEVRFLNREDAMNELHLAKAKASYHPDLMVEKWRATRVGADPL